MQTLQSLNNEYRVRVNNPEAADIYGIGQAGIPVRGKIHLTCEGKILCKGVPVEKPLAALDTKDVTCQWCQRWLDSELSA